MIIKKNKNKNQYILDNNIYIRDFTNDGILPIDLNEMSNDKDKDLFLENELDNLSKRIPEFDFNKSYDSIVIINSGYDFSNLQFILNEIPKNVCILGVNYSLKNWKLINKISNSSRAINYYIVNNPYDDCVDYIPHLHNYYPQCICSTRTNINFINLYKGNKNLYCPTSNEYYSGVSKNLFENKIDDYRNPICASLHIAYKLKANKIFLFCCDDSFDKEKPGSVKLENNLFCYPQQIFSNKIIGNMCYWLKNKKIEIYNYSNGGIINNTIPIINNNDFLNRLNE